MKILTSAQLKELDKYTIAQEPIPSIDLMERAAQSLTDAIIRHWDSSFEIVVFAGPGNNGGDALAVARMLSQKGYHVEVFLFNTKGSLSEECQKNLERLKTCGSIYFTEINTQFDPPTLTENHLVIDGLFGSGLNVEIHIELNSEPQLRQTVIIFDFDVFVFQRPPETLHFCIIPATSTPVHADLNSIILQFFDELITCKKLAALVGIKDFRLSKAFYRHSQRFHTVKRIHRIDHIICHQFAAEPVYDADYKCPVPINCRIGNICTPYLIGMIYF